MSIINNNLLLGAPAGGGGGGNGREISRSLRFNAADSAYLSRTPASAGNRKTWTWAGWVKRSEFTNVSVLFGTPSGSVEAFDFDMSNRLRFYTINGALTSTSVYRDPSAWMHVVAAVDTTQATSSNRIKLYVNGLQLTQFDVATYPAQDYDTYLNNNNALYVGDRGAGTQPFSGYLADIHFIDGQALDPTSFGEFSATTGVWVPKAYTGSYGTNGFHLDFSDNSAATATTLGKDAAGSNNWTPNNLSVTAGAGNDSLVDVPTNGSEVDTGVGGEVRGNYCTLNPLDQYSTITLSNGNLQVAVAEAAWRSVRANLGMSTGKWYWEVTLDANTGYHMHGIGLASAALTTYPGNTANSWGLNYGGGALLGGNSTGSSSAYTSGMVLGFAFNADTGRLDIYQNGSLQSGYFTLPTGNTYFPMLGVYGNNFGVAQFNAGQRPFAYTAPSGFKALCTANLPAPVVTKPSTVMDVALYTGTGSSLTVSSLGFSPDLVWLKSRGAARNHRLTDTVRGATIALQSDLTSAEVTEANGLTAFNSNGFTVGSSYSVSSEAWVGWCWDAGSSTVTNTQGSISSQVRANASAGFSIVTYTGTGGTGTVGHGLGVAPSWVIIKNRTTSYDWIVYANESGTLKQLYLNLTLASSGAGLSLPSSTTFNLAGGGATSSNGSGDNYVAYCFAPVAGYSSFGSYTGNGNADGPFVYTGFRPRWILVKRTDAGTNSWAMFDTARSTYNVVGSVLFSNLADAEFASDFADVLSNGFKLRSTSNNWNGSTFTYIYAAFAEHPFALARAR